jgi:glycerophosphoryl diester phosphodiesterase
MKAASINEIKKELTDLSAERLVELLLQVTKYKKDNKELLTYLLFEAGNKQIFISSIKKEVKVLFEEINQDLNLYFTRKSIRKILRLVNKYAKYIDEKEAEVELLIYFLQQMHQSGIPYEKSTALNNLFDAQKSKIKKLLTTFHEDLQHDYLQELTIIATDA